MAQQAEESMDTTELSTPEPVTPPMHTTVKVNDDGEPVLLSYTPLHSPYCHQISMQEYREQAVSYTQQALKELQASPEYRKHVERCHSCGVSWYEGQWTQGCKECGDTSMTIHCPICNGVCGAVWKRNVEMSHSFHDAHWDGVCRHKDKAQKLVQLLHIHSITDALEELQTDDPKSTKNLHI